MSVFSIWHMTTLSSRAYQWPYSWSSSGALEVICFPEATLPWVTGIWDQGPEVVWLRLLCSQLVYWLSWRENAAAVWGSRGRWWGEGRLARCSEHHRNIEKILVIWIKWIYWINVFFLLNFLKQKFLKCKMKYILLNKEGRVTFGSMLYFLSWKWCSPCPGVLFLLTVQCPTIPVSFWMRRGHEESQSRACSVDTLPLLCRETLPFTQSCDEFAGSYTLPVVFLSVP